MKFLFLITFFWSFLSFSQTSVPNATGTTIEKSQKENASVTVEKKSEEPSVWDRFKVKAKRWVKRKASMWFGIELGSKKKNLPDTKSKESPQSPVQVMPPVSSGEKSGDKSLNIQNRELNKNLFEEKRESKSENKESPEIVRDLQQNELKILSQNQPIFRMPEKGKENIEKTKEQIKSQKAFTVVKEKKEGQVPKNKAGVPSLKFETHKNMSKKTIPQNIEMIPFLDIGEESQIKSSFYYNKLEKPPIVMVKKPTKVSLVERIDITKIKKSMSNLNPAGNIRQVLRSKELRGQPVTIERVNRVVYKINSDPAVIENPILHISSDELELLAVLILYERDDQCHMISGLLNQLSHNNNLSHEINYYLGICSKKMGFFNEAVDRLLKVIEAQNSEYAPLALKNLLDNLPLYNYPKVAKTLKKINPDFISNEHRGEVAHIMARVSLQDNDFSQVKNYASKINKKDKLYGKGQFLLALAHYGLGNKKSALDIQENLMKWADENSNSKSFKSLVAINLARMRFQNGFYKGAIDAYLKMGKDHPLWVDGLMEQGWAQLLMSDYVGAVGNMYSIHGPFFKMVYKPESYVIRGVGYLNLCQYADSFKSVSHLENEYSKVLARVEDYRKSHLAVGGHYQTIRTYLKGSSNVSVDGLPYHLIREIARHHDFIKTQSAINHLEDENEQISHIEMMYLKTLSDISLKIKKNLLSQIDLEKTLSVAKKQKSSEENISLLESKIQSLKVKHEGLEFQQKLYQSGKKSFDQFCKKSKKDVFEDKEILFSKADKILSQRLNLLKERLTKIIDNNELVKYEIFSGSGENLRYQVAGGAPKDPDRTTASIDDKSEKNMNWGFEGEYWEDEIGHYRSSLKNNCSDEQTKILSKSKGE